MFPRESIQLFYHFHAPSYSSTCLCLISGMRFLSFHGKNNKIYQMQLHIFQLIQATITSQKQKKRYGGWICHESYLIEDP